MVSTRYIKPFDPWRSPLCTCPPKWSLNPYTGCGHGCLYCYVSGYVPRFYSPRVKRGILEVVGRDSLLIPPGSTIELSSSTDPFQPMDGVLGYSSKIIELLLSRGHRILIATKGTSLLSNHIHTLEKYRDRVSVAVTITTLSSSVAKLLEPFAPQPADRVRVVEELSKCGLYVTVRIDPIIPGLNDDLNELKSMIGKFVETGAKQITVSTYKARYDSLKRLALAFPDTERLWKRLYIDTGERMHGYLYLPRQLRYRLMAELKSMVEGYGLGFATCREGFPHLHTKNYICDGTTPFRRAL
ncbi:MAG: radical SAM protein [Ignisphaera sp.]|nr:radical SAM protein [Ignisphaera sp.]MDW8084825.1 radical SAM protein [Ignisphaera sp.]